MIIDDLLNEIEEKQLDQKLRILSDKINDDMLENMSLDLIGRELLKSLIFHPSIFIATPVPSLNKDFSFVCLEREKPGVFIITKYLYKESDKKFRKENTWDIPYDNPKKILLEYISRVKTSKSK